MQAGWLEDLLLQVVIPVARAFQPDLVLVSAGFDAAEGDPLGGMKLSPAGAAPCAAVKERKQKTETRGSPCC